MIDDKLGIIDRQSQSRDPLAQQLVEETRTRPEVIPVVCVDEFLSFSVLNSPVLAGLGVPVFSMTSKLAPQISDFRRETPQHYLSFAIKRHRTDGFQEYLQDALTHFLLTECETTATLWANLAKRLLDQVRHLENFPQYLSSPDRELLIAERWRYAWDWVQYTLHLDMTAIDSYHASSSIPWKPILLRAREIMHEYFAANENILEDQARLSFARGANGHVHAEEQQRIAELFDVEDRLGNDLAESPKELADSLRLALLNRLQLLSVAIRVCDTRDLGPDDLQPFRGLLRNLQGMYELMGRPEPVKRIDEEIDDLPRIYGGENGRIILATSRDGAPQTALGVIFLDVANTELPGEGELRFLWVRQKYRRFGVGNQLLARGIELGRELGSSSLRVEILPELRDAIHLVQKHGFHRTDRRAKHEGRLVFVRHLQPSTTEATGS